MDRGSTVYIAGHRGLVGSAILRRLESAGFSDLVTRTSQELDLRDGPDVRRLFQEEQPDHVYLAAAKVGGIHANDTHPAEFLRDNIAIQTNVIHEAHRAGVEKLCFLGSSCIYPKHAPQPMPEDCLLTASLEPTNQWYAIAKIAGLKMCQAYRRQYGFDAISVMPTNLYGPGDNFDLETSHVLPAMIRKFHEAKNDGHAPVTLWGTGSPRREFLHVDDLADACLFLMEHYADERPINVGVGEDIRIDELARLIQRVVGHEGTIEWEHSKPDGTPRKLMDVARLHDIGWKASIPLEEGIRSTYGWFLEHWAKQEIRGAPASTS